MKKNNLLDEKILNLIFDRLFPIPRSICGPGIRKSLQIINEYMPLNIEKFKTNDKVLDWTVPQEWSVTNCKLTDPSGKVIIDFKNNNLHVLNFSDPFKGYIHLNELKDHIFTNKDMPDAIPYVTSYYEPKWGICMSEKQKNKLKKGLYHLDINTKKYNGFLEMGVSDLTGKTKKTVMLTSYLCHPSMANNELSGPLGLILLYSKIKNLKNRFYSYKFLINPETIGSLAYLSRYGNELEENLEAGYVVNCIGGPSNKLKIKKSRKAWLGEQTFIDKLSDNLQSFYPDHYETRDFNPTSGSDERQYCSPGFNLPFNQISRTTYLEYKEYHTNKDDKEFMGIKNIIKSVDKIFLMVEALEYSNRVLKNNFPFGEPFLSDKGLYPSLSKFDGFSIQNKKEKEVYKERELIMMILSLADNYTLYEISLKINVGILELISPLKKLLDKKIIKII